MTSISLKLSFYHLKYRFSSLNFVLEFLFLFLFRFTMIRTFRFCLVLVSRAILVLVSVFVNETTPQPVTYTDVFTQSDDDDDDDDDASTRH